MKRSEINEIIRAAEVFFEKNNFMLPPFAKWTLKDWKKNTPVCAEILECYLGWDLTDFGKGNFKKEGLLLFTIRNGVLNHSRYTKPYAEKLMLSQPGQLTLMHYHAHKTEDIINRGGGKLSFRFYNSKSGGKEYAQTPVNLSRDGLLCTLKPGEKLTLEPGESVTLTKGIFHEFWAEKDYGPVLIGEVSAVNDDHNDNFWIEPQNRFPEIEEDVEPYRLLVIDYDKFLK